MVRKFVNETEANADADDNDDDDNYNNDDDDDDDDDDNDDAILATRLMLMIIMSATQCLNWKTCYCNFVFFETINSSVIISHTSFFLFLKKPR